MFYAYIRVSSKQQKIDRQFEEIKELGVKVKRIYIDKESGKNFNRTNYKKLIERLKHGDLLVIKSIDRLGRNYRMILDEWYKITKVIGANIKVIDMPLLDTRVDDKNLVGSFISDIVLQILSFVAENERTTIKSRQMEGIDIARKKGIKFGRPISKLPCHANDIFKQYFNHVITSNKACQILKISKGTFFRLCKKAKEVDEDFNSVDNDNQFDIKENEYIKHIFKIHEFCFILKIFIFICLLLSKFII